MEQLKKQFLAIHAQQGSIFENDYHSLCAEATDEQIVEIGDWLVSSGFRLRRGVGDQYKQELLKRLKKPDVNDVKDTKDRQHKNTDKEQEAKRIHLEERKASVHLNYVIEELKCGEFKDEFLPAWKKRKAVDFGGYVPTMRDMAQALMDYVSNNSSTFKNYREWLALVPEVDSSQQLSELWDLASQGITEIPAEIKESVGITEQKKALPKNKYRTDDIVFEEADEPQLELAPAPIKKKYSLDDPVDVHIRAKAKEEYTSKLKKKIKFDTDAVYTVDVAETPAQKAAGLEVFDELPAGCGLLFPFEKVDHVTFHMGRVKFPIDILFFMKDDLGFKVAKIVHEALPGTLDIWSNPHTACVLELPGGTCRKDRIRVNTYCHLCED
jgi:uncharacterized membrane protein (UPF0127 family)